MQLDATSSIFVPTGSHNFDSQKVASWGYLQLHHLIVVFSGDDSWIACSAMPPVLPTGSHDFPFPESGIAGLV